MISWLRHTKDLPYQRDLARRDYWRDHRDRITAWKRGIDTFYNGMEDGRGNRYHYDDEGELDVADYRAQINPETGAVIDPKRRDTFSYDALGNRAGGNHVASMGDVNFTRRDNGLNQYLDWTPSAIYHDDNYPASPSVALGPPRQWGHNGGRYYHGEFQCAEPADGDVELSLRAIELPVVWVRSAGAMRETLGRLGQRKRCGLQSGDILLL
jgi:hypothetical protein